MPLLKCPACGYYTLQPACPKCNTRAVSPGPAKYSPEDHYGKYRRLAKKQARAKGSSKP